jgi:hypothetical protein
MGARSRGRSVLWSFQLFAVTSVVLLACGLEEHPRGAGRSATLPAGDGVEIAGTWVPRERAIVFVHFGHSNMAGVAQAPAGLRPLFFTPQPRLWSYRGGGQFVPAVEPTAPDPPMNLGAGPGMAWLRAAAAAAGPQYHFISVAWAHAGAGSADFLKGGLYYDQVVGPALELRGRVTFGAILIMLGITERPVPVEQEHGFAQRMARVIADLRQDLGAPDLPVLHTDYEVESTGPLAPTAPIGMRIRAQYAWLPVEIPNLVLIPADHTTMVDDHHFDLAGHELWVERGLALMRARGWFPWPVR